MRSIAPLSQSHKRYPRKENLHAAVYEYRPSQPSGNGRYIGDQIEESSPKRPIGQLLTRGRHSNRFEKPLAERNFAVVRPLIDRLKTTTLDGFRASFPPGFAPALVEGPAEIAIFRERFGSLLRNRSFGVPPVLNACAQALRE